MNNKKRKIFWDTLNSLDGIDREKDFEKIKSTIRYPETLCRYRSVNEFSIFELLTNQLYIPSAIQYDDPFDTFINIDWQEIEEYHKNFKNQLRPAFEKFCADFKKPATKEAFQKYSYHAQSEDLLQEINLWHKKLRLEVQQNAFSVSFTEKFLNETLWLKYANSHKGFCLVYNLKEELQEIERSLFPIYYSTKPYSATQYATYLIYKGLYNNLKKTENITYTNIENELASFKLFFAYSHYKISLIKKECHHYDQEWRYLSSNPNKKYLKWKPSKIIIGLKTPEHHKELIKNAAKIAGIETIEQAYINSKDELDLRPI